MLEKEELSKKKSNTEKYNWTKIQRSTQWIVMYFRTPQRRRIKRLRLTIPRCAWNLNFVGKSFFAVRNRRKLSSAAQRNRAKCTIEGFEIFQPRLAAVLPKHLQPLSCLRWTFPRTWLRISSPFPSAMLAMLSPGRKSLKSQVYERFQWKENINRKYKLIDDIDINNIF